MAELSSYWSSTGVTGCTERPVTEKRSELGVVLQEQVALMETFTPQTPDPTARSHGWGLSAHRAQAAGIPTSTVPRDHRVLLSTSPGW